MESLLGPAARALLIAFLVSVMVSVGLEVTAKECLEVFGKKRLIIGALLANFVVVPLLGLAISKILPMPANIETGFLLLAAAPGALFAINFTPKLAASKALSAALLFLLTLLSLLFSPFLARVLLNLDRALMLPYARAMAALFEYIFLPMLLGLALNHWVPTLAAKLRKPTSICAAGCFVLEIILTGTLKSGAMKNVGVSGLCAMMILVIMSMIVGWLFGGPDDAGRSVLTVNTSLRNVALCLAIAAHSFPEGGVDVAVIAFSTLMLPPNALFTFYQVRRMKRLTRKPVRAVASSNP
jgi:bile acid:Na+ symporter, BASS family